MKAHLNVGRTSAGLANLLCAGTLALVLCAASARASVEVSFSVPASVAPGSTFDSFDVLLANTAGGSAISISAFTFEVMASGSDVVFTDATTATVADPYIFSGNSLFGPDIMTSNTGQDLIASDLFSGAGGVTVAPGATVGLGHVLFNVSPTAPSETVDLSFVPVGTSLAASCCVSVPIDVLNTGQLNITSTSTPEPSTLSLLVIGLGMVGVWRSNVRLFLRDFRRKPRIVTARVEQRALWW